MNVGARDRARLLRRRYDEAVALHRHLRATSSEVVMLIVDAHEVQSGARVLPPDATHPSDDGETVLVSLPAPSARRWLGHEATTKWEASAPDAMDIAIVAAGGVSIMRLSAR